jgi:hypothetical protein
VISPALTRDRASSRIAAPALQTGLTGYGVILFFICLFLAGSGMQELRETATSVVSSKRLGMTIHPYLILVAIVFPLVFLQRITIVPRAFLAAFAVFSGLTYISTFYGGVDVAELVKISATFVTIITSALLVRTREDFLAGVAGMAVGVGILAIIGVENAEGGVGQRMMGGHGRNAFSLFSLPMIFLGAYVLTRERRVPALLNIIIIGAIATSMIGMILTLNRSGWLGAGVIALLLIPGSKLRGFLIVGAVAVAVLIFFRDPVEVEVVRERMTHTGHNNTSDQLRWNLIEESVDLALAAPLLGVSPQQLPIELGRRLNMPGGVSAHNVLAHVMAGSGIPCLIALLAIGGLFWRWRIDMRTSPPIAKRFREARHLLRMMLVLWLVRGLFTHEILYSPAFSLALGLCFGICLRYASMETVHSVVPGRNPLLAEGPRRRRRLRVSAALEM